MIDEKSDITMLIKMCIEENLINVLFEEEIIHAITTPRLVNHLLKSMSPSELFMEAIECRNGKDDDINLDIKNELREIMATYEIDEIKI